MKILLLEDDYILNESLSLYLQKHGYTIDSALSIEEAEDLSFDSDYDLYLLDINLPVGNGLEFLRTLRVAQDYTDVIFITALHDMHTMAEGFELGAMDYIKKPFNPQELLIRIRAKFDKPTLNHGHISFDRQSKVLKCHNAVVDLGAIQLDVFEKLLLHPNQIVPKDEFLLDLNISDVALRVAITKLKQKLDINITNIRGKGYMLEAI